MTYIPFGKKSLCNEVPTISPCGNGNKTTTKNWPFGGGLFQKDDTTCGDKLELGSNTSYIWCGWGFPSCNPEGTTTPTGSTCPTTCPTTTTCPIEKPSYDCIMGYIDFTFPSCNKDTYEWLKNNLGNYSGEALAWLQQNLPNCDGANLWAWLLENMPQFDGCPVMPDSPYIPDYGDSIPPEGEDSIPPEGDNNIPPEGEDSIPPEGENPSTPEGTCPYPPIESADDECILAWIQQFFPDCDQDILAWFSENIGSFSQEALDWLKDNLPNCDGENIWAWIKENIPEFDGCNCNCMPDCPTCAENGCCQPIESPDRECILAWIQQYFPDCDDNTWNWLLENLGSFSGDALCWIQGNLPHCGTPNILGWLKVNMPQFDGCPMWPDFGCDGGKPTTPGCDGEKPNVPSCGGDQGDKPDCGSQLKDWLCGKYENYQHIFDWIFGCTGGNITGEMLDWIMGNHGNCGEGDLLEWLKENFPWQDCECKCDGCQPEETPTEPVVTEPEVTEPEVTEPEVTQPEVTQPEVTQPEETTCPPLPEVNANDNSADFEDE